NTYKGKFVFKNQYREGVKETFDWLGKNYHLAILSGDNEGEKMYLKEILPSHTEMAFNQKPQDKLKHIEHLQNFGHQVVMVGEGLNVTEAIQQSKLGIAIAENVNVSSTACDGILDASKYKQLPHYIRASNTAIKIVKASITISFLYDIVGLYFAVTGQLAPVVAAIIMPMSSISVVAFTTVMTNLTGRKLR